MDPTSHPIFILDILSIISERLSDGALTRLSIITKTAKTVVWSSASSISDWYQNRTIYSPCEEVVSKIVPHCGIRLRSVTLISARTTSAIPRIMEHLAAHCPQLRHIELEMNLFLAFCRTNAAKTLLGRITKLGIVRAPADRSFDDCGPSYLYWPSESKFIDELASVLGQCSPGYVTVSQLSLPSFHHEYNASLSLILAQISHKLQILDISSNTLTLGLLNSLKSCKHLQDLRFMSLDLIKPLQLIKELENTNVGVHIRVGGCSMMEILCRDFSEDPLKLLLGLPDSGLPNHFIEADSVQMIFDYIRAETARIVEALNLIALGKLSVLSPVATLKKRMNFDRIWRRILLKISGNDISSLRVLIDRIGPPGLSQREMLKVVVSQRDFKEEYLTNAVELGLISFDEIHDKSDIAKAFSVASDDSALAALCMYLDVEKISELLHYPLGTGKPPILGMNSSQINFLRANFPAEKIFKFSDEHFSKAMVKLANDVDTFMEIVIASGVESLSAASLCCCVWRAASLMHKDEKSKYCLDLLIQELHDKNVDPALLVLAPENEHWSAPPLFDRASNDLPTSLIASVMRLFASELNREIENHENLPRLLKTVLRACQNCRSGKSTGTKDLYEILLAPIREKISNNGSFPSLQIVEFFWSDRNDRWMPHLDENRAREMLKTSFRFDVDRSVHMGSFGEGIILLFYSHIKKMVSAAKRSPATVIRPLPLLDDVLVHIPVDILNQQKLEYGGKNVMDVIMLHGIFELFGNFKSTIQALVARGGRLSSIRFQKEIHEKRVFDFYKAAVRKALMLSHKK